MLILSRAKVTGEGVVDTSTIENLHFNFLIFNSIAEVSQDGKVTGGDPFSPISPKCLIIGADILEFLSTPEQLELGFTLHSNA
jgi:hypothetical protein